MVWGAAGLVAGVVITFVIMLVMHKWVDAMMKTASADIHKIHTDISSKISALEARVTQTETTARLMLSGAIAPQAAAKPTTAAQSSGGATTSQPAAAVSPPASSQVSAANPNPPTYTNPPGAAVSPPASPQVSAANPNPPTNPPGAAA